MTNIIHDNSYDKLPKQDHKKKKKDVQSSDILCRILLLNLLILFCEKNVLDNSL